MDAGTADTVTDDEDGAADVVLDVRPLIERGEEPFGTIMQTVAALDGRALMLIAPFEPTPLQGVLGAQGFTYRSEQVSEAEWRVRFEPGGRQDRTHESEDEPSAGAADVDEGAAADPTVRSTDTASGDSPFTIRPRGVPSAGSPARSAASTSVRPTATGSSWAAPASAMPVNPTLNVPPPSLPLGLLAAAAAGLIGFGAAMVNTAPTAMLAPRHDHVIAAAHLGVLAFLSTAVLGALHQFGPVVGGRPLRSIRAAIVTALLWVPGVWLIPVGFATGRMGVLQAGGVLATTAVCVAAWNLSRPLSASGRGAPIVGLRLAVSYLVLTAAFGVTYAFDRGTFWFSLLPHRVLAHAHLGLFGWLGLAYVAVAEKLWPMFLLAHRPHARDGERAVRFVGAGAPLLTVGLLFGSAPLTTLAAALVAVGLGFHLASLASVIRHRRRGLEVLHGFVLASAACLVGAVVMACVAGVAPVAYGTRSRLVTAEVLCAILWLTLAVVGHSHKIVPFISWNRLRDRGITTAGDGRPLLFAHLVNPILEWVTFLLAVLAAVCGVVGALTGTVALVRVAGVALLLVGVGAVTNLASGPVLIIRRHGCGNTGTALDRTVTS
ncbi:MAG: DUF2249 domain-containing protein [Microthrixaceae bacterium]